MNRTIPSPARIVQTDYFALLSLLAVLVAWAIYLGATLFGFLPEARGHDPLMGEEGRPFWFKLAVGAAAVGIPVLTWRIALIRGVFGRGVEVPGLITALWFYRDRGRVEYAYHYGEQEFVSGTALHKTARAKALREGQQVALVVDPENPRRAFIRSLYLED